MFFSSETTDMWFCGLIDGPCYRIDSAKFISDPAHGATSTFEGVVRNQNDGLEVVAVDYDVHATLALKALRQICSELTSKYPVKLAIVHSRGLVRVGEASVIISASGIHRRETIDVVSEAIDLLKIRVPIWKKEIAGDRTYKWLEGNSLRQD